MKKKVARVLFAFVLILAMIPLTASAESSADTEDNEVTEQFDQKHIISISPVLAMRLVQ